ncbi:hypothetical protein CG471_04980 [Sphingobium sp. IP1]|nr:hypothetical protein CG471_04980 [Sphingobium sp. IP1]
MQRGQVWPVGLLWWLAALASVTGISAGQARPSPATTDARLPVYDVREVVSGDQTAFEVAILAPPRWGDRPVRSRLLRKAAQVAAGRGAHCFAIERAQLNRNVSYVPLRSGHMTISTSGSAAEWRRYWRLYRNVLASPGIHFGLGTVSRIGNRVVEGRLLIRLCQPGAETPRDAFEVQKILSSIRASEPAGSP